MSECPNAVRILTDAFAHIWNTHEEHRVSLRTAVHEPKNLPAREGMALAATLAGLAFSNCGVALVHALEYPIGAAVHCSHGAGNGLLLPYVMRFNLGACEAELARAFAAGGHDTHVVSGGFPVPQLDTVPSGATTTEPAAPEPATLPKSRSVSLTTVRALTISARVRLMFSPPPTM